MEEELNYLNDKVEGLILEMTILEQRQARSTSKESLKYYMDKINKNESEKQILENILSVLTISELNKQTK